MCMQALSTVAMHLMGDVPSPILIGFMADKTVLMHIIISSHTYSTSIPLLSPHSCHIEGFKFVIDVF